MSDRKGKRIINRVGNINEMYSVTHSRPAVAALNAVARLKRSIDRAYSPANLNGSTAHNAEELLSEIASQRLLLSSIVESDANGEATRRNIHRRIWTLEEQLWDCIDSPNGVHHSMGVKRQRRDEDEPTNFVCYGMIHNACTNKLEAAHTPEIDLDEDLVAVGPERLQLSFKDGEIFLSSLAQKSVAVMNESTRNVLQRLDSLHSCQFKAYLATYTKESLGGKSLSSLRPSFQLVDVVIYGPKAIRNSVGQILSSAKAYLQHPSHLAVNTEYDNPHILIVDDLRKFSTQSSPLMPRTSIPNVDAGTETPSQDRGSSQIVGKDQANSEGHGDIDRLFETLTRFKSLKRLEADIRITTKLLPHQEEALDFIAQRESGPIPSEYALWKICQKAQQTFYEHVITGKRELDAPIETVGGILADDMGLGKTLTMLATIIRTLGAARTFAGDLDEPYRTPVDNSVLALRNSRATLVVVPSSILIDGWRKEIQNHCNGSLNVNVYHGRGREIAPDSLADWDIVLTTFHTIAAEALDEQSPLTKIKWFRIVLDEAHIIRSIKTKLYQSVAQLASQFRWCLTGTPIQNSLEDLASLVAFIKSAPLDQIPEFRKAIVHPLTKGNITGERNLRVLLDSICLRRTKKLLDLPSVFDNDRYVEMSSIEEAFYFETQAKMVAAVKQHDSQSRNSKDYFGVFQLHLQLRRLCNHGTYQKLFEKLPEADLSFDPDEVFESLRQREELICLLCNGTLNGLGDELETSMAIFTFCGHLTCSSCRPSYNASLQRTASGLQCHLCHKIVPSDSTTATKPDDHVRHHNRIASSITWNSNEKSRSSKVSTLIHDIKTDNSEGKSIIFSCWTRSLDLVAHHLQQQQIAFTRIDGSYTLSQRKKILEIYDSDPDVRVLLMTTGTGAVGLNLTVANCVYILEPQWNPMVENQAIARLTRLGQKRNVKVIRYIMKGTVEVGMRSQQATKLGLAKLGWNAQ